MGIGFVIILIIVAVRVVVGVVQGVVEYRNVPKPPKYNSYKEYYSYYKNKEWEISEEDELRVVHKQERIELLDDTIIKYNKLLDNLAEQYRDTWDAKKRSAILAKQIVIQEKLNRALEKREKLDS